MQIGQLSSSNTCFCLGFCRVERLYHDNISMQTFNPSWNLHSPSLFHYPRVCCSLELSPFGWITFHVFYCSIRTSHIVNPSWFCLPYQLIGYRFDWNSELDNFCCYLRWKQCLNFCEVLAVRNLVEKIFHHFISWAISSIFHLVQNFKSRDPVVIPHTYGISISNFPTTSIFQYLLQFSNSFPRKWWWVFKFRIKEWSGREISGLQQSM